MCTIFKKCEKENMSMTHDELLKIFSSQEHRHVFCSALVSNVKQQLDKSLVRQLLHSCDLKPGELPLVSANVGDLYIDEIVGLHEAVVSTVSRGKLVLRMFEIGCQLSYAFSMIRNTKDPEAFIKSIESKLFKDISYNELRVFSSIISKLHSTSQEHVIKHSNELVDVFNDDNTKYVFCRNIIQKSDKLIRLDCIEPGTYLVVSDLRSYLPRCGLNLLPMDDPGNIGWSCYEQIGMLVRRPTRSIKFIDQDYFDRTYTNKFKYMMEDE